MTGNSCADDSFVLSLPRAWAVPLVVSAPHSGTEIPFTVSDPARRAAMAAMDDTGIHALALPAATGLGFPVLSSRYGRAYIDLNRDVSELDPLLVEGVSGLSAPGSRVATGLGLIPRLGPGGVPLYSGKLSLGVVQSRIHRAYAPYHRQLKALIEGCLQRFGTCVLIDLHSMPPVLPAAAARALSYTSGQPRFKARSFVGSPLNLVLGDCFGASVAPALARACVEHFQGAGLSVAHNRPYAGGHITAHYGRQVAAFQLEVCRSLYPSAQGKGLERVFFNFCQALPSFPSFPASAALASGGTFREAAE